MVYRNPIPASGGAIYVAWTTFQRRQVSMADYAGFECIFLPRRPGIGRIRTLRDYARLFFLTLRLLRERTPATVWVQLPQVPLLWTALLARALWNPEMHIVADCHNAMLRPPWSRFPFGVSMLRRVDAVLVHNADMLQAATSIGVPRERIFVVEDVPAVVRPNGSQPLAVSIANLQRPMILFPGSFAADEPAEELIAAALELPHCTIVMTGRLPNAERRGIRMEALPPNVVLPGYLPVEQFEELLRTCDLVLAFTKTEGIQLSVCNEALGFGKPMLISGTRILTELFGDGAAICPSADSKTIAKAIHNALGELPELERRSRALALRRRKQWLEQQYKPLADRLGLRASASGDTP